MEKFMQYVTADDLKKGIDRCIYVLNSWKENVTEQNFSEFSLTVSEHRDLDPTYSVEKESWGQATGFKQTSPMVLDITLQDNRKRGKRL
jgi:hypothetical protein